MTKEISDCKVETCKTYFAFFDSACVAHHEYVPGGTTVNASDCVEVLSRLLLRKKKKKRPEKWYNGWILHYYDA
jgi:hypothetical protein